MSAPPSTPRIVAVAGNMGAGKSSLVEWLRQQFGMVAFFEPNEENPYLSDFYADMPRWAMSSQLFFLVRRFQIHREVLPRDDHTPKRRQPGHREQGPEDRVRAPARIA